MSWGEAENCVSDDEYCNVYHIWEGRGVQEVARIAGNVAEQFVIEKINTDSNWLLLLVPNLQFTPSYRRTAKYYSNSVSLVPCFDLLGTILMKGGAHRQWLSMSYSEKGRTKLQNVSVRSLIHNLVICKFSRQM